MNPEERRRLIGNDLALIFFIEDEDVEFSPQFRSQVNSLGFVVRCAPDSFGHPAYNLGAFSRKFQTPPPLYLPQTPVSNSKLLRRIILTNLINGIASCYYSPPFFDLAAET